MLAAPRLLGLTLPTQSAGGVSEKGNRIIPRWGQISEKKERLSPQWELKPKHLTSFRPPLFLITHYSTFKAIILWKLAWHTKTCAAPI
jgi:hypothetical protein